MSIKDKNRPLLIFGLTIIFLIGISYLSEDLNILGYEVKPFNLFTDIEPDSLLSQKTGKNNENSKLYVKNSEAYLSYVSWSLINTLLQKFEGLDFTKVNDPRDNIFNKRISTKKIPLTGNTSQMKYFYQALKNSKNEKIRIAHFGDSEIEGDLITADIRNNMQSRFGGLGVGMLSIISQDINFRTTTKQTFSDNWETINVLSGNLATGNSDNLPIGINGFMSIPEGVSWVRYETTGKYSTIKLFTIARVFYTNAKSFKVRYAFNDGTEQTTSLVPGKGVKELMLKCPSGATSFKLTTESANQADFYAVSLEDGNGIYVDNFPWRGNTGISFRDLNEDALKGFDRLCNYKLIIINFGGNQVSSGDSNYNWFENQMIKNIRNLKSIFPGTSFVLISVGDKSKKIGTSLTTDPLVLKLIETQERIADSTGIAFWNLFEAMGGKNSMIDWVDANPPLAIRDYTHINLQGAKVIADLFTKALLADYR